MSTCQNLIGLISVCLEGKLVPSGIGRQMADEGRKKLLALLFVGDLKGKIVNWQKDLKGKKGIKNHLSPVRSRIFVAALYSHLISLQHLTRLSVLAFRLCRPHFNLHTAKRVWSIVKLNIETEQSSLLSFWRFQRAIRFCFKVSFLLQFNALSIDSS